MLALNKKEVEALAEYLRAEQPDKAAEFELIINSERNSPISMDVLAANSSLGCLEGIAAGLHDTGHPNLAEKIRTAKVKHIKFNPDEIYLVREDEIVSIKKAALPDEFSILYVSNSSGPNGKGYSVFLGSTVSSIHNALVTIGGKRVYFNPQPRLYSSIDSAANASFSFVTNEGYSVVAVAKNIEPIFQRELVGKIRRENNLFAPKTEKPYAFGKFSIAFFPDAPGDAVNYELSAYNGGFRVSGNGVETIVEDIEGIGEAARLILKAEKGARPIYFSVSNVGNRLDISMIKGAVALAYSR